MQLSSPKREATKMRAELERETSARQTLQLQLDSKEQMIAGLRAQLETTSLLSTHPLPFHSSARHLRTLPCW